MFRVLPLITALSLVPLVGSAEAEDKPRHGGELIFAVPSEPPSYDAHQEETFGLIHPMAPHYSTLMRVDPTDRTGTKPVGDLAESWTIPKDGLVYTFKLRKGVKFQTTDYFTPTRELNADDVIFSFERQYKTDNAWNKFVPGASWCPCATTTRAWVWLPAASSPACWALRPRPTSRRRPTPPRGGRGVPVGQGLLHVVDGPT